ncbi:hypothetical protein [Novosphingobium sp. M1R2S20]|uniref:Uncharacterized protein n=1 Tax=Novosphingobium rhizovicinum TaxID=3228928 RepID=A0ABV3RG28_9SPHN
MHVVTDADREAAEELRVLLADVSGFWHVPGDAGPICAALARHRVRSELRMLEKINHAGLLAVPNERMQLERGAAPARGLEIRTRKELPNAIGR